MPGAGQQLRLVLMHRASPRSTGPLGHWHLAQICCESSLMGNEPVLCCRSMVGIAHSACSRSSSAVRPGDDHAMDRGEVSGRISSIPEVLANSCVRRETDPRLAAFAIRFRSISPSASFSASSISRRALISGRVCQSESGTLAVEVSQALDWSDAVSTRKMPAIDQCMSRMDHEAKRPAAK